MRCNFLIFPFLFLLFTVQRSYGQCEPALKTDSAEILFSGPVNKMINYDHYMIAGGNFNAVGVWTGSYVNVNSQSGRPINISSWPRANGTVNGVLSDGAGNLIVYGSFTKIGDSARTNLAMIDVAGNIKPLQITVNGAINAAVIYNGILYIGGYFTQVNSVLRSRLAAFSISTGALAAWDPNVQATVSISIPSRIECMNLYNGVIYVGGTFNKIGSAFRKNIAAIDAFTGNATGWAPEAYFNTAPDYGTVVKMHRVNNLLYICGQFDIAGGQSRPEAAALDITTGSATTWRPNPDLSVFAFANSGDTLYVGGGFSTISSQPRMGFAAYSISTGALLPIIINTKQKFTEQVKSLAVVKDTIYVGGLFDTLNNQFRKNMAAANRFTGSIYPFVCHTNGPVTTILRDYGSLYMAGSFISANMKQRNNLAAIDLDMDTVDSWKVDVDGEVISLGVNKKKTLFISGYFTKVKDSARTYAAAIDFPQQQVTSWNPRPDSIINDFAFYHNDVYIGGWFHNVGSQPRNGLARIDSAGNVHAWVGMAAAGSVVNCLEVYNDSLYVGGIFTNLGGASRNCLGAVNLSSGLATAFNPGANYGSVTAMCRLADTLLVGGLYNTNIAPPGAPTPNFMYVDRLLSYKLSKAAVIPWFGGGWGDGTTYFDNTINDLVLTRDQRVYAVGAFSTVTITVGTGAVPRKNFALLDLAPVAPPPIPGPGGNSVYPKLRGFNPNLSSFVVNTACVAGNLLFCGGNMSDASRGYLNAAMFYIPFFIVDADATTDTNGICSNTKVTVRANSNVTYGATYSWFANGVLTGNTLPYYSFVPANKDSISCVVTAPATACLPAWDDTTNSIVFNVIPRVVPVISIASIDSEDIGKLVTVKATVMNADTGYTIEWFNKGVSIGKTKVDSITYTKDSGTDSIYAIITPRPDTCYVTDTSGLITVKEKQPVEISNITADASVQVYPNPFSSFVTIRGLNEGDILMLYDVTGRKVAEDEYHAPGREYTISSGNLNAGTYMLKITDKRGVSRKNVLIQKQ